MKFEKFARKVKEQDTRNAFDTGKTIDDIPEILSLFFIELDPVDVEVNIEGAIVRFVPISEYFDVQKEYSLGNEKFIFATSNGDPIFLYDNAVYTCAHGTKNTSYEKLAGTFEEYLNKI